METVHPDKQVERFQTVSSLASDHTMVRRLDLATDQSASAVTAAIAAATAFSQADLDAYLVNTVASGLPAREFWNPR